MLTDYKFWYIKREDNVHISECAVRFYEGEINTQLEMDRDRNMVNVTRYRRLKKLRKVDLPHFSQGRFRPEVNGSEARIFTTDDFGVITTDDELRLFVNGELKKDASRSPINEQI